MAEYKGDGEPREATAVEEVAPILKRYRKAVQEELKGVGEGYVPLRLVEVTLEGEVIASGGMEALEASGRSVILGPPGSGKSTLLAYLAYEHARQGEIPFFLDLSLLAPGEGLREMVSRALADYGLEASSSIVDYLLGEPHLLLLDNLDQVTNNYCLEELERLLSAAEGFVLACREGDYPAYARWLEKVKRLKIERFSDEDIRRYLSLQLPESMILEVEKRLR
ncbi:MAG: NACHT domain-containing protein, partial [Anaerolineae bacterium]